MTMDGRIRGRLLLSFRSEAAMGLRSSQSAVRLAGHGNMSPANGVTDRAVLADAEPSDALTEKSPAALLPASARSVPMPVVDKKPAQPRVSAVAQKRVASSMDLSLPILLPILTTAQKTAALAEMNAREVSGCKRCQLQATRKHTVFGEGEVDAEIFFIGEGPGETEDQTGRPFVGRAGQLLDKMIAAMGLSRQQVFIANIVKCRPPDNRVPAPDEVQTCTPYLVRQLEIVRPKVIVTLGLPAVKYMLEDPKLTMGRVRGQWKSWRGIKLMPTYHPSYVLRAYTEANRMAVWSDLQLVMQAIGLASVRKVSG